MKYIFAVVLAAMALVGCERSKPAAEPEQRDVEVQVGGPEGGVHVEDPASGTKVDVDAGGVDVETPKAKVEAP